MIDFLINLGVNTDEVKFQKAVFYEKKNSLSVFLIFSKNIEDSILEKIKNALENKFGLSVKVFAKKSILDIDLVNHIIKTFMSSKYANLLDFINKEDIAINVTSDPEIIFKIPKEVEEIFQKNEFIINLQKELDNNFFEKFNIETVIKIDENLDNSFDILAQRTKKIDNALEETPKGCFNIVNCEKYIGEDVNIFTKVSAIEDLSTSSEISVCCGKIKYFTKRSFEKLVKKEKKIKEYYTFTLNDGRSNIACTYFGSEQSKPKMEKLVDGDKLIVVGTVELFRDKLNFKPKNILLCEDFVYAEPKKIFKGIAEDYKVVSPVKYIEMKQVDLLSETTNMNISYLKNKSVVVFDVETTGLNYLAAQIIEIGAVKIENGEIVETFSTLIKPHKFSISEEITGITGITPQMVENSPKFSEIVGDFYKFCSGSILVAHNADFDMSFIKHEGEECNYFFDNQVMDTLALARQFIKGVKNYKLKTLVDHLLIDLENAHRASSDALATAKLFLHLCKFM